MNRLLVDDPIHPKDIANKKYVDENSGDGGDSFWTETLEEDGIEYQDGLVRVGNKYEVKEIVPPSTGKVGYGTFYVSNVDGEPYYIYDDNRRVRLSYIPPFYELAKIDLSNAQLDVTSMHSSRIQIDENARIFRFSIRSRRNGTYPVKVLIYESIGGTNNFLPIFDSGMVNLPNVATEDPEIIFTLPTPYVFISDRFYRIAVLADAGGGATTPRIHTFSGFNGGTVVNFTSANFASNNPLLDTTPETFNLSPTSGINSPSATTNTIWTRLYTS